MTNRIIEDDDEAGNRAERPKPTSQLHPASERSFAPIPLSLSELVVGALALVAWFAAFGGGIIIGTDYYWQKMATATNSFVLLGAATVIFFFWTITNVGILACMSAFFGAFGRRTRFAIQLTPGEDTYLDLVPSEIRSHYASAVIRGFGIYIMVMAGLLVLATESFQQPTQGSYLRLAATISVIAFYAGYDPELFVTVMQRVKRLIDVEAKSTTSESSSKSGKGAPVIVDVSSKGADGRKES